MDFESALKRVRMEVKFGRVPDERLRGLWDEYRGTDKERIILEIYAFDLLMDTGAYREAIPALQRLLELDIDDRVRSQALELLHLAEAKERLLPSEPDASNPEFVEFMEILRRREIFKVTPNFPATSRYFPVRRLQSAKRRAWHQGISAPYQSWNQLRTNASRDVYTYCSEHKIRWSALRDVIDSEIIDICESSLTPVMMHFFDDIYGDLCEIATGKLVGVVPDLHARMWEAYQANTYPCGWRGDYPDGKLCVFPNR